MIKLNAQRILAVLGVIVLVVGGYVGWQMYKGQQIANQYAADAQKQAQGSGTGSAASNSQALVSQGITSPGSPGSPGSSDPTAPSQAAPSQNPPSVAPESPEIQPNSSSPTPPTPPSSTPSSEDYKKLMAQTYQQTLQTMQNVKANTLAFQGKKFSLSAYKASIVQSQALRSS